MGYDQNHAGIHLAPYGARYHDYSPSDKYSSIIADEMERQFADSYHKYEQKILRDGNEILKNVKTWNYILLEKNKGEVKKCSCGTIMNYKENIEIRYKKLNYTFTVHLTGKQCPRCHRILMVESNVINAIRERNR